MVIVIDPMMSKNPQEYVYGLKKGGDIFLNHPGGDEKIVKWARNAGFKLHVLDARKISLEEISREIYNVPMLAAMLKVRKLCDLSTLEKVLAQRFSGRVLEMNLKLVRRASEEVETLVG